MKVVMIVPGGFDPSGRERVIPALLWLAEQLSSRHELHVCVAPGAAAPRSYRLARATIHDLGRAPGGAPGLRMGRLWRRLAALLAAVGRAGPIDVVHGFWAGTSGVL